MMIKIQIGWGKESKLQEKSFKTVEDAIIWCRRNATSIMHINFNWTAGMFIDYSTIGYYIGGNVN